VVIEARGWYARILQHEIDHLGGTLYVDRMQPRSLTTAELHGRRWREKPIEAARAAFGIAVSPS
jgi:peptide deformylase